MSSALDAMLIELKLRNYSKRTQSNYMSDIRVGTASVCLHTPHPRPQSLHRAPWSLSTQPNTAKQRRLFPRGLRIT